MFMLAITATILLGGSVGMSALAANTKATTSHGGDGKANITINVTCNNNQQLTRHASSGNTAVNVNVNCGSSGGGTVGPAGPKGDTGAAGTQGENGPAGVQGKQGDIGATGQNGTSATICIVAGNETCGLTLPPVTGTNSTVIPPMLH